MGAPNVGVTGVIQDPGLGGNIARGLGGISQMLMQQDQIRRQQEQEAYQRKLMQDQLDLQQKIRDDALRGQQQVGQGLTDLMTPQTGTLNLDSMTGMPMGDVAVKTDRSIESVLAKMDPQFRAQFLEASQPIVQDRKTKADAAKQERAYDEAVRDLPDALKGPMRMAIRLQVNKLVPSEVIGDIYRRSLGAANATPEQMAKMREKYPEFALLPDDDLVEAVGQVAALQVRSRLGVLYKPDSGGGGGGTSSGMTPAQKQRMASLEKSISTARMELARYNKRSPVASEVQSATGRRITPLDPGAAVRHVSDSTQAFQRFQTLLGEKEALQNEIDGTPSAPGQMSVPQLAAMANEALAAVRRNAALTPAQKAEREAAILAQYKQMAVQAQLGGPE